MNDPWGRPMDPWGTLEPTFGQRTDGRILPGSPAGKVGPPTPPEPWSFNWLGNTALDFTPFGAARGIAEAAGDMRKASTFGELLPAAGMGILAMAGAVPGGRTVAKGGQLAVRPARENLRTLIDSNFEFGRLGGHKTMPIDSLRGSMSAASDDVTKATSLAEQMRGPNGYIERLVVDDLGNVIEGQHRLNALKQLGIKNVPVTVIEEMGRKFDVPGMQAAIRNVGSLHPDQVRGVVNAAFDALRTYGSAERALAETVMPAQWQAFYGAALRAATRKAR